jgi:hypothetical protein
LKELHRVLRRGGRCVIAHDAASGTGLHDLFDGVISSWANLAKAWEGKD